MVENLTKLMEHRQAPLHTPGLEELVTSIIHLPVQAAQDAHPVQAGQDHVQHQQVRLGLLHQTPLEFSVSLW